MIVAVLRYIPLQAFETFSCSSRMQHLPRLRRSRGSSRIRAPPQQRIHQAASIGRCKRSPTSSRRAWIPRSSRNGHRQLRQHGATARPVTARQNPVTARQKQRSTAALANPRQLMLAARAAVVPHQKGAERSQRCRTSAWRSYRQSLSGAKLRRAVSSNGIDMLAAFYGQVREVCSSCCRASEHVKRTRACDHAVGDSVDCSTQRSTMIGPQAQLSHKTARVVSPWYPEHLYLQEAVFPY